MYYIHGTSVIEQVIGSIMAAGGLRPRDSWCSSVRKARHKIEAERHEAAKERRRRQAEQGASKSSSAQTFVCLKCGRVSTSRIRLYSNQQAGSRGPSAFLKILVCQESAIIRFNNSVTKNNKDNTSDDDHTRNFLDNPIFSRHAFSLVAAITRFYHFRYTISHFQAGHSPDQNVLLIEYCSFPFKAVLPHPSPTRK